MSIEVNRVDDKQFPFEIIINNDKRKFTDAAYHELLRKMKRVHMEQVREEVKETQTDVII